MKEIRKFGNNLTTDREKVLFDIFKALEELPWAIKQALDKRITALEESVGEGLEELSLSDEVGGLSGEFARATEERNKMWGRITALEAWSKQFSGRGIVCAGPPTPTPLPCCEGCADYPCKELSERVFTEPDPDPDRPTCYRESHTCGECKYPWSREHFGRVEQWVLVCDRVVDADGEGVWNKLERVSPSRKACPNFEAVE